MDIKNTYSQPEEETAELSEEQSKGWWERKTGERLRTSEKVFGVLALVVFLFVFWLTLDANKYKAQVKAIAGEGKIGVNPTTERLDFGDLARGTTAVRRVSVKNSSSVPFFVTIVKIGSASDLVKVETNNFILREGEEEKIRFTVFMPASAEVNKLYTARVFLFKIPAPFF